MSKEYYSIEYEGKVYSLNQACKEANIAIPSLSKARKNHPDMTIQQIFNRVVKNSKAQFIPKISVSAGDYFYDGDIVYKVLVHTEADMVLVSVNGLKYIDRTEEFDLKPMNKNQAYITFKKQLLSKIDYQ